MRRIATLELKIAALEYQNKKGPADTESELSAFYLNRKCDTISDNVSLSGIIDMLSRNGPCPCKSNKSAKRCCMDKHGLVYKPRRNLPLGDPASTNDRCYLNFLGGCSSKISREHLMTDAILKEVAKREPGFITRKNAPDGKLLLNPYPLASEAKVLCRNHNSILGDFSDSVGLSVYNIIMSFVESGNSDLLLVNGHDLERFVMQRVCAYQYAGLLSFGDDSTRDYAVVPDLLRAAFASESFAAGRGLFVTQSRPHVAFHGTEVAHIVDPRARQVTGGRVSLGPVSFVVSARGLPVGTTAIYRPKAIEMAGDSGRLHKIILSWDRGSQAGPAFRFSLRPEVRAAILSAR